MMADITWPTGTDYAQPESADLQVYTGGMTFESGLSDDVQTFSQPGYKWGWKLTFPEQDLVKRRKLEALLLKLKGVENRALLFDFAQPTPTGTIALAGVTLNAAAAQFAPSLVLAGCGAGATINAGDWLSLSLTGGSIQAVKVTDDAVANGSGVATVNIAHVLRAAAAGGTAVTTSYARQRYVLRDRTFSLPRAGAGRFPPFTVEFVGVPL